MAIELTPFLENDILKVISDSSLSASQFSFPSDRIDEPIGLPESRIGKSDKGYDSYFILFEKNRGKYFEILDAIEPAPHIKVLVRPYFKKGHLSTIAREIPFVPQGSVTKHDFIIYQFKEWIKSLEMEVQLTQENLRLKIGKHKNEFIDFSNEKINDPFTDEEKVYYKEELKELKNQLNDLAGITSEEIDAIREEINDLNEKIELLNKKDFMKYAEGAIKGYLFKKISTPVFEEFYKLLSNHFSTEIKQLGG